MEFTRRGYALTVDVRQRRARCQLIIDVRKHRRPERHGQDTVSVSRLSGPLDEAAARQLLSAGYRPVTPLR